MCQQWQQEKRVRHLAADGTLSCLGHRMYDEGPWLGLFLSIAFPLAPKYCMFEGCDAQMNQSEIGSSAVVFFRCCVSSADHPRYCLWQQGKPDHLRFATRDGSNRSFVIRILHGYRWNNPPIQFPSSKTNLPCNGPTAWTYPMRSTIFLGMWFIMIWGRDCFVINPRLFDIPSYKWVRGC